MQYRIAKENGDRAWELVLISSAEADIKVVTLWAVKIGEPYYLTKERVDRIIANCVDTLETPVLKQMTASELPMFASRIYLQWLEIYGTFDMGMTILALLRNEGKVIPQAFEKQLHDLPRKNPPPPATSGEKHQIPLSSIDEPMEIPKESYNWAVENETYPKKVEEEIRRRTNKVLMQEAKEAYERGYPSIRASAERALRWEWQQDNMAKMLDSGERLVWIDTHVNCSERCEPWQGRLYSLDHTTGEIDGIKFVPIEEATDIYYVTKLGRVWKNGCLSGFNCRHKMIPYRKGNKPDPIPKDKIAKERDLEAEQRQIERTLRRLKLMKKVETNAEARASLRKQISSIMEQYRAFCNKHKLPCMVWRTEI